MAGSIFSHHMNRAMSPVQRTDIPIIGQASTAVSGVIGLISCFRHNSCGGFKTDGCLKIKGLAAIIKAEGIVMSPDGTLYICNEFDLLYI